MAKTNKVLLGILIDHSFFHRTEEHNNMECVQASLSLSEFFVYNIFLCIFYALIWKKEHTSPEFSFFSLTVMYPESSSR